MNLLAIETTGAKASVAMLTKDQQLWEEHCDETLNHLRLLIPLIERLLEKSKLEIEDIDGIAVSEGPGSFTGIRIGMSTAKALAQALNLDIVCVPTLKSFAYNVSTEKRILCPIFDARRSQIYAGAYIWKDNGACEQMVEDGAYALEDFLNKVKCTMQETSRNELLFFGDGIQPYKNKIEEWVSNLNKLSDESRFIVSFASEEFCFQRASSIAFLGYELWKEGKAQNLFEVKPVYLRQAEAQRKLEEAEAKRRAVHG